MEAKIIIGADEEETRMGLLEDNRLVEYLVERSEEQHLVGSIFKGRVANVVRGIQAAFIDIGLAQNAFLYLGENVHVTEGQSVIVQISKDPRGTKGPTATLDVTLPGKYLVLLPGADYIGVSRKINDKQERERLNKICAGAKPEGMGLIVRTAAREISAELLTEDIRLLVNQWKIIVAREKVSKHPGLLRRELDLPVRIVRDYLRPGLKEIAIDNLSIYKRVEELLEGMPQQKEIKLTMYQGLDDIFKYNGFEEDVASISDRQVELPSGGYLVFDYTEAMTVVDVNSGKFTSRESLEETIMQINREAAKEIARQLRLRDIGGIIIVDFIDMHTDDHKKEIMSILQKAFAGDKMQPKLQEITALNLVEITRKKSRQNLSSVLYAPCPICSGTGRVQSQLTLALELKRRLRSLLKRRSSSKNVLIMANPWLADWIELKDLKAWERELACSIKIESDPSLHIESFMILDNSSVDKS
ncbi:MAG: Rne/Rng family ribonuclease [Phascolarctobacterium sp.]|nr:Rne/Rng family ribonuclease [Phascolarctobacterium sp.]